MKAVKHSGIAEPVSLDSFDFVVVTILAPAGFVASRSSAIRHETFWECVMRDLVRIVVLLALISVCPNLFACPGVWGGIAGPFEGRFLYFDEKPDQNDLSTAVGVLCLTSDFVVVAVQNQYWPESNWDKEARETGLTGKARREARRAFIDSLPGLYEEALFKKAERLCGLYGKSSMLVGTRAGTAQEGGGGVNRFDRQQLFACVEKGI